MCTEESHGKVREKKYGWIGEYASLLHTAAGMVEALFCLVCERKFGILLKWKMNIIEINVWNVVKQESK